MDDAAFEQFYLSLTNILLSAAHEAFLLPSHKVPLRFLKPQNPTIALILCEICHINRLISACNSLISQGLYLFPSEPWVSTYFTAFHSCHSATDSCSPD